MDKLSRQLATLPKAAFPDRLHFKLMRQVLFESSRKPLTITTALFLLALIISSWHFFTVLINLEVPSLASLLLRDFELSFSYVRDTSQMIALSLPPMSTASFVITLIASIYFAVFAYKRLHNLKQLTFI